MAYSSLDINVTKLPNDKQIVSVDYQISNNGLFTDDDIIENIEDDVDNLSGRIFDLNFNECDIYYGRVRLYFDEDKTLVWGWSKPIPMTSDGNGYSYDNVLIVTPEVKISVDAKNCELGNFKIITGDFVLFRGNDYHKYTTYEIVDLNGNILWSTGKEYNYLTEIRVPNEILKPNNIYIINVVFYGSSNQRSNTGKLIVKTIGKSKMVDIIDNSDDRILSEDYRELMETYEELLTIVVNNKALGNECII